MTDERTRSKDVDYLCWLDLETAGGDDERESPVLEVGLVLTTVGRNFTDLTVIGEFQSVVVPPVWPYMPDVVEQMHRDSGLWAELKEYSYPEPDLDMSIGAIDTAAASWIVERTQSTQHVGLAGSGVSHFDRRFVRAQMPLLHKRLTYWALDVGVIRRGIEMAYGELPEVPSPTGKNHRALDDARYHLEEWKAYRRVLSAGAGRVIKEERLVRGMQEEVENE